MGSSVHLVSTSGAGQQLACWVPKLESLHSTQLSALHRPSPVCGRGASGDVASPGHGDIRPSLALAPALVKS